MTPDTLILSCHVPIVSPSLFLRAKNILRTVSGNEKLLSRFLESVKMRRNQELATTQRAAASGAAASSKPQAWARAPTKAGAGAIQQSPTVTAASLDRAARMMQQAETLLGYDVTPQNFRPHPRNHAAEAEEVPNSLGRWCDSVEAGEWGAQLRSEWADVRPITSVTAMSSKKTHWRCGACGHTWQTAVANRTSQRTRCPGCVGRVATASWNLSAWCDGKEAGEWGVYLKAQWADARPMATFTPFSTRLAAWRCDVCRHCWDTPVQKRSRTMAGCPACVAADDVDIDAAVPVPAVEDNVRDWCASAHSGAWGSLLRAEWCDAKSMHAVSIHSSENIQWRCATCGATWDAPVRYRCVDRTSCGCDLTVLCGHAEWFVVCVCLPSRSPRCGCYRACAMQWTHAAKRGGDAKSVVAGV